MTSEARVGGYPYRVDGTTVSRRVRGAWVDLSRADLLALPRDGAVWEWLRAQGIKRPSPSGATQAEGSRARKPVMLRLTTDELADVDAVADDWGVARSDAVARLAKEARR